MVAVVALGSTLGFGFLRTDQLYQGPLRRDRSFETARSATRAAPGRRFNWAKRRSGSWPTEALQGNAAAWAGINSVDASAG
jgi:hypothetical protein